MSRKGGLGRGLSALIGTPVPVISAPVKEAPSNIDKTKSNTDSVNYLKLNEICQNAAQPRQKFSESELKELASSIKSYGVLQPILVRPKNGAYEIVAGERRFRAAKEVGLSEVPVVIREITDRESLEIALVENVQRQGLNPIEEARGYQRLIDEFSLSAQEVAERVGKERATIANTVRLLRLPEQIMQMVEVGELSVGHAKAILTVKEPAAMIGLAQKVKNEGLSVRALEAIVSRSVDIEPRRELTAQNNSPIKPRSTTAHVEISDRLRNSLATKVVIEEAPNGAGVIKIHYHSGSELDRLIDIIAR